jgi:glycosyltransferase involved in cell wall biosynthesis
MKIDIIIPLFNEEGNIIPIYNELTKTLKSVKYNLIFVDDGSKDSSYDKLKSIYLEDKSHIKVIRFSRNFGKDAAIYAGLNVSNAEYACIIDADLQQNPKYILDMLKFIEENKEYDEIAMVNNYQNESFLSKASKKCFYRIMGNVSGQTSVAGASDFRLFNRKVVEALLSMKETNRFSKGLFSWVGFNVYYMNYDVEKRNSGESKFKLKRQISYASNGILNFSTKPLRSIGIAGAIIAFLAFIYLVEIIIQTICTGKDIPGYASIMCVILIFGGLNLLVLGIIGEYIARAFIEAKKRPIYIEKESLGFDNDIL